MFSTTSLHKENLDHNLTSSMSGVTHNPSEMKMEISMHKKEVKRLNEAIGEREREFERLKKENANLLNRCRAGLSSKK